MNAIIPVGCETVPPVNAPACELRKAMRIAGCLSDVQTAIDTISDSLAHDLVQLDWEFQPSFARTDSSLAQITQAMGLTSSQVDALFVQANALVSD